MTTAEVGRRLGVTRRRAASFAAWTPDFPAPVTPISEERLFDRRAVDAWAATHPVRDRLWKRPKLPPPGEMAPSLHRISNAAATRSAELNHHWIGDVHLLLALLHPDCPGAARPALEAFGLAFEAVRRSFVERLDRTFDTAPSGQSYDSGMQRILEQAHLEALELQDDEVDSEHALLALAGMGKHSAANSFLTEVGADAAALRRRVIALTESTTAVCDTPEPASAGGRTIHAAELARRLGVSRRRAVQLASSASDFPSSQVAPEGYRVWPRHLVDAWVAAHLEREVGPSRRQLVTPGGVAPRADEVLGLARARAEALNHDSVGPDHLLLAVLDPDCPGQAREALESLGTNLEEAQRLLVESMGDPFDPHGRTLATAPDTLQVLERARLKVLELEDEEVTSEHVLLALADIWHRAASMLIRRGIDADAVRHRLIALSDGLIPAPPCSPPPHWQRSAKRIPRPPEPELDVSPAGHDPMRRRPWGSRMLRDATGQVIYDGKSLRQYFIDRDGYPVRSPCGRLVCGLDDENGMPVLDQQENTILTTIEAPPRFDNQPSRRLT